MEVEAWTTAGLDVVGHLMSRESDYIAACFEELESARIEYAILHGAQQIPYDVSSDIDIVVRRESLRPLIEVLRGFAERHGGVLAQAIRHQATACYHVLALPDEGNRPIFVIVDASVDYRAHGCVFFTTEELLRDRRRVGGVWSVAPPEEFVAYLTKRVLKGSLEASHLAKLQDGWSQEESTCYEACEAHLGSRNARLVADVMRGAISVEHAERSLLTLRHGARTRALWRHPLMTLGYWLSEPGRFLARVRNRTGFHVAVLGPDGVGKSSLLDSLVTRIAPAFRRVEYLHLKPGLLPSRARSSASPEPYQKPEYETLLSVAKLVYLALDYVVGYWVKLWPRLVASTLILADRYYLDVVADPRRYRYGGPSGLPRILSRFVPGPDLYVVLGAPPETIQKRKAEVPLTATRQQTAAYETLVGMPGVSVVDAAGSPEEVGDAVVWTILQKMADRQVVRP